MRVSVTKTRDSCLQIDMRFVPAFDASPSANEVEVVVVIFLADAAEFCDVQGMKDFGRAIRMDEFSADGSDGKAEGKGWLAALNNDSVAEDSMASVTGCAYVGSVQVSGAFGLNHVVVHWTSRAGCVG